MERMLASVKRAVNGPNVGLDSFIKPTFVGERQGWSGGRRAVQH